MVLAVEVEAIVVIYVSSVSWTSVLCSTSLSGSSDTWTWSTSAPSVSESLPESLPLSYPVADDLSYETKEANQYSYHPHPEGEIEMFH